MGVCNFLQFFIGLNQAKPIVKTIVKLLIVLSVAINTIALLADGLPVTSSQVAPSGLTVRHPGESPRHQADSAGPVPAAYMTPCNEHGNCKLQNNNGCSLHHHPAFVAAESAFNPIASLHIQVSGLNAQMSSYEVQPETPPPKYPDSLSISVSTENSVIEGRGSSFHAAPIFDSVTNFMEIRL